METSEHFLSICDHLFRMYATVVACAEGVPEHPLPFSVASVAGSSWPAFLYAERQILDDLENKVAHATRAAKRGSAPRYWWIVPGRDIEEQVHHMLSDGWMPVAEYPCMSQEISKMTAPSTVDGLELSIVKSSGDSVQVRSDLQRWLYVAGQSFGRLSYGLFSELAQQPDIALLQGKLDGQTVATSMAYFAEGIVGVHHVNTLSQHRKQGIGSALFYAAAQAGLKRDCKIVVAQSTPAGKNAWRALGLESFGSIQLFWLPEAPK